MEDVETHARESGLNLSGRRSRVVIGSKWDTRPPCRISQLRQLSTPHKVQPRPAAWGVPQLLNLTRNNYICKMLSEKETSPLHISVVDDADGQHKSGVTPRSSSGWDGKLRVEKKLELTNPEALSDPEYSDEEQVLPGEEIEADEGMYCDLLIEYVLILHQIS
jgi:hypothetical protein